MESSVDRQLGCMVVLKYVHKVFDTTSFKKWSLIPLSFAMWAKLFSNGYNRNDGMQLLGLGSIRFGTSSLLSSGSPTVGEVNYHDVRKLNGIEPYGEAHAMRNCQ